MIFSIHLRLYRLRLKTISIFLFLISLSSCQAQVPDTRINGISLVASRKEITNIHFQPIKDINANSVAVMPYGFMDSLSSPHLRYNVDRQWWGEREEGAGKTIQLAKQNGLSVMLKPQIWIRGGDFTGHIEMNSMEDWQEFGKNYREFILLYAELAEKEKVQIFCIGTELNSFVSAQPAFWVELIKEVRKVYNGQLTYAENWDKIEDVHFWKSLDFIGVDAYFPLNDSANPSLEQIKTGWHPVKKQLNNLSQNNIKPILFTEYGYRNVDFSTQTPWDANRENKTRNDNLQAIALEALFLEIWNEPWFAGGYLWKWHHEHAASGGPDNNQFTPQNKPAEGVVKEYYGKFVIQPE